MPFIKLSSYWIDDSGNRHRPERREGALFLFTNISTVLGRKSIVKIKISRIMPFTMPGTIQSAYIFSLLSSRVRSAVMNTLSATERDRLNRGLAGLSTLSNLDKKTILARFIGEMRSRKEMRERLMELSMIASLLVLAIILAGATAMSVGTITGPGRVEFVEAILAAGGFHCALLPLLLGYCRAELAASPASLLLSSRNRWLDAGIALVAGLLIAAAFMAVTGPAVGEGNRVVALFTLAAAATAAPVAEEIVFRHLLFTVLGKKTGLAAAAALSSLLFAAVHLPDSIGLMTAYTGAGMALCGICYARRSLFPALLAHAVANTVILLS